VLTLGLEVRRRRFLGAATEKEEGRRMMNKMMKKMRFRV
jgi:hypothetical protein